MIVQIAVIGAFGLIGLGIIATIVSGIKSMTQGKQDIKRIGIMAVPFVIFAISYLIVQGSDLPFAKAGVLTAAIMMGIMVVSVFFTGLRGTFKF
tara:strand:+ start:14346 stop:14627 length:282 start_codon:yes stop_codon:yes gene_type:complete